MRDLSDQAMSEGYDDQLLEEKIATWLRALKYLADEDDEDELEEN